MQVDYEFIFVKNISSVCVAIVVV